VRAALQQLHRPSADNERGQVIEKQTRLDGFAGGESTTAI